MCFSDLFYKKKSVEINRRGGRRGASKYIFNSRRVDVRKYFQKSREKQKEKGRKRNRIRMLSLVRRAARDHGKARMSAKEPCKDIEELHGKACDAGEESYIDPESGYQVMTAVFLSARRKCCGSRCRHCPYGHQAVKGHVCSAEECPFAKPSS